MATPLRLGKYEILDHLAKGGMAEVYKAKAVGIAGFERILAVKRILPKLASEPRFIRSFIDEARIAVELNHRNIVQVVDFGKSGSELFLAMEFIDGIDLRTALITLSEHQTTMPVPLACFVLSEVAAGLDYAHHKKDAQGNPLGIVHCDVSPQNVMLSYDGFVKILDFGVARAGFVGGPRGRRLRGKPRYMAPEQTRADTPTFYSDVFALGIVSWELLTGLRLFEGKDVREILEAVRRAEAPAVDRLNPEVPGDVAEAIAKALSPSPVMRGTAAELGDILSVASRGSAGNSRALAEWVESYFPRHQSGESTQTVQVEAFMIEESQVMDPVAVNDEFAAADEVPTNPDQPAMHPAAPPAGALLETRRAAATNIVVEGSTAEARRDLVGTLAHLGYKLGAVVRQESDDSVVAFFGLEVAGEDDLSSAMQFALDAMEVARSGPASVRIATRAGLLVQRRSSSYQIVGEALSEIRELAREAEPFRPLLAGSVGRLASAHFDFRELSPRMLGASRLRVLELLGPTAYDQRARALHQRRGRFIGRDAEIETIMDGYRDAVRAGHCFKLAVVGPTGVGKSRLVAEVISALSVGNRTPLCVAVAASPTSKYAPFTLVVELLQAGLNVPPHGGAASRGIVARRLRGVLAAAGDAGDVDLAVEAAELAMEARDGALVNDASTSPDLVERVTDTMRRFFAALSQSRHLAVIIENLHDADLVSMTALARALGRHNSYAGLLAVTARPGRPEADEFVANIGPAFVLDELDAFDRDRLIRERLGQSADPKLVAAIADRTGGNPLFIEELAAAVREHGDEAVPDTAREVILARVDRLGNSAKVVLQHAAVIGANVRARILEDLLASNVDAALTELCESSFLQPAGRGSISDSEGEYVFCHGLIREVVYGALTEQARRATHARLGDLLGRRLRAGRDEPPAVVARHYELAEQHVLARPFWLRAGQLSLAYYFAESAVEHFSKVLDESVAAVDAETRWAASLGRAQALQHLGTYEQQESDLQVLTQLAMGDAVRTMDVELVIAERCLRLGKYSEAIAASELAERAARDAAKTAGVGKALRLRAEAFERQGDYDKAIAAIDRATAVFESIDAKTDQYAAQLGRGRIFLMKSDYQQAGQAYAPLIEHMEDWSDPWLERLLRNHVAVIELCLGRFESAMRSARKALSICERYGDRARAGDNQSVCGIILSEVGQYREADEYFQRAVEIHRLSSSRWAQADCLVYVGLNQLRRGDAGGALVHLTQALAQARDIGARYVEANALCAMSAVLLRGTGPVDVSRALDCAVQAVELADEAGLVNARVLARSSLAHATWRTGDVHQALGRSAEAVSILDAHQHIEAAEEEVYFTHYKLLKTVGDVAQATYLRRATVMVKDKLASIQTQSWRASFVAIPVNAEILSHDS